VVFHSIITENKIAWTIANVAFIIFDDNKMIKIEILLLKIKNEAQLKGGGVLMIKA